MRLATFNILNGRSPADGEVDLERYADAIRSLRADVVGLQEVDRSQPRSGSADLTAIAARAMDAQWSRFAAALSGTPGSAWTAATGKEQPDTAAYGIALLSRFPVLDWGVVRLRPVPLPVPLYFHQKRQLAVVRDEPRVALWATIRLPHALAGTPGREVTVATTHLSFVPGWNLWQLWTLARELRGLPQPVVLCGDLNLTRRWAGGVSRLTPTVAAATFPSQAATRQLDHVLVRDVPGPYRGSAVRTPVSDHQALVVDFRID